MAENGDGPFLTRRGSGNVLTHILAAVLAAGLAAGLLLAFDSPASGGPASGVPASSPAGGNAVPAPPARAAPLAGGERGIVTAVTPGVVIISTTLQYNSETAAGAGMVISSGGLVLTNNHVIEDSTAITVTVAATGRAYPARVVGYDTAGDVALLQLQGASRLATVPIGNSSSARVSQAVVALGNAEGGTISAAAGQVTGLNQTVTASKEAGSTTSETLHGMIQTNADIASGDFGGPLAGPDGVIGMDAAGNDAGYQQQAVGFAIPINAALAAARQIAAGRASSAVTIGYPPFLGIFVSPGSDGSPRAQAQQQEQRQPRYGSAGSPPCYTSNAGLTVPPVIAPAGSGALVDGTICGSPAARAGMTGGAVITAVNGRAVGSPGDLSAALARFRPGEMISVTWVSPSGTRATSALRLTAGPPQ
jgi:S1-C subfamily serine protease